MTNSPQSCIFDHPVPEPDMREEVGDEGLDERLDLQVHTNLEQ